MIQSGRPRIIAGFGRSGTTWVHDVLAKTNSLRAVFEPLHEQAIEGAERHAHKYLARDDNDTELYDFLSRYFYDEFHSLWADYRLRVSWLYPDISDFKSMEKTKLALSRMLRSKNYLLRYRAQRKNEGRIIKLIRANMMLSWLEAKFDARIVFIIRHPAAVVLSQLRGPRSWKPHNQIERYRSNEKLLEGLNPGTKQLLFASLDTVEALSLSWCIENKIALEQAHNSQVLVVYYENLLEFGRPEWNRILTTLDFEEMPDSSLIRRPSQQAWGKVAQDPKLVRNYASWMAHIDADTAARIRHVLDVTEMADYSMDCAMPVTKY